MKKVLDAALLVAVLSLSSVGVAESATPPLAGSCSNTVSGFCNEFSGSSYKAARVEKSCKSQGMTFLAGGCPTEKLVGTCLVYKGKDSESSYRYYANFPGVVLKKGGGAKAAAEKQCLQLKGEWTPN